MTERLDYVLFERKLYHCEEYLGAELWHRVFDQGFEMKHFDELYVALGVF
jgi:hypothetical protein